MAGNVLAPPERIMRDTIDWLLDLPQEERTRMEQANSYTFTVQAPAPKRDGPAVPSSSSSAPPPSPAFVLAAGCTSPVEALFRKGLRPAVMNFAHGYNCGGGFEHAGGSQEEAIIRASSVFLSLWPHRRADDGPGVLARGMWIGDYDSKLARKEPFYPHTNCGGVYSPHVLLVRRIPVPSTPLLPLASWADAPEFSVLTVAAQDCNRDGPFDPDLLYQKVRTALHMAASNGNDAVVLGAFGCGVFRNPPEVVAQAFKRLLEGEFAGAFKVALFTIPDRGGANLRAFETAFGAAKPLDALGVLLEVVSLSSAAVGAGAVAGGAAAVKDGDAADVADDAGDDKSGDASQGVHAANLSVGL
eukprot:CAMPEP_0203880718 /NCGR_PEP_ID=MMETSP0359-20131031/25111_1 /ASSEMBLY_ACC=CAM_ASM_000338 /TAXON_ID=268821 /ORGANISM="Scrippsiella Hangoei, Strain SHTV-5" /LENGTH=357 /DNA_ID=CAMNT_0050800397 /DNA_START=26 /DNA_END=1100 /DNA_ORIENTATION=+